MRAGRLRHRVTIQQRSTTLNSYGETTGAWTAVATVPADVVPVSGKERLAAGQNQSLTTIRVHIRYRSDVTTAMRLVHGAAIYGIEAVIPTDGRRERLELLCTEGQADG